MCTLYMVALIGYRSRVAEWVAVVILNTSLYTISQFAAFIRRASSSSHTDSDEKTMKSLTKKEA